MAWPEDQKLQTRRRILDSAARLFAVQGFDAVNIDMLMADAGLTRGAFYHHFRTKAELLDEAIGHAAQCGGARFDAMGDAALGALVQAYLRPEHVSGQVLRCPLAFMATDMAHQDRAVRNSYTRSFSRFIERIQQASASGTRAQALQMAVMLIGGVALARSLEDEGLVEELLAACRAGGLALISEEGGD